MDRHLQSKTWPQCSLIRESRLHFYQENQTGSHSNIFFQLIIINFVMGTLPRFFNMAVIYLMEY